MANREREISGLTRIEFGRLAVGPTDDGGRERESDARQNANTFFRCMRKCNEEE